LTPFGQYRVLKMIRRLICTAMVAGIISLATVGCKKADPTSSAPTTNPNALKPAEATGIGVKVQQEGK
jgi:hypothetical protein